MLHRIYFLTCLFLMLCACDGGAKKAKLNEIKTKLGVQFQFPASLNSYVAGEETDIEDILYGENPLIVSYIDSARCSGCALSRLRIWRHYADSLKKQQATLIFIVCSDDTEKINRYMADFGLLQPVIFDRDCTLIKKNEILFTGREKSFVLDKRNRVVMVGSPVSNPKSWELYRKTIGILKANEGIFPGL